MHLGGLRGIRQLTLFYSKLNTYEQTGTNNHQKTLRVFEIKTRSYIVSKLQMQQVNCGRDV